MFKFFFSVCLIIIIYFSLAKKLNKMITFLFDPKALDEGIKYILIIHNSITISIITIFNYSIHISK